MVQNASVRRSASVVPPVFAPMEEWEAVEVPHLPVAEVLRVGRVAVVFVSVEVAVWCSRCGARPPRRPDHTVEDNCAPPTARNIDVGLSLL